MFMQSKKWNRLQLATDYIRYFYLNSAVYLPSFRKLNWENWKRFYTLQLLAQYTVKFSYLETIDNPTNQPNYLSSHAEYL